MKNNVISVLLYGKEICKIQWQGGYKQGFGKVGTIISFNPTKIRIFLLRATLT